MYSSLYHSPLGQIKITASDVGLLSVLFIDKKDYELNSSDIAANHITEITAMQLKEYFENGRKIFEIPLCPVGTPFQQGVWQELTKVPFGETDTYTSIAKKLNNPLGVRAVGAANGKNPISIIIPCHRIIGANGTLTGYAGGLWRKERLLKLEGVFTNRQTELWQ